MCFSASASFATSGVLAASGIAISRIQKPKSEIPLSLFPYIFATHQFIEGILWLNHTGVVAAEYKLYAVYGFVFIAYVLWPICVPFSAYVIETGRWRRGIILLSQCIGLYVGLTALISIIRGTVDASVVGHGFAYSINTPDFFLALYLVSVSVPFLMSKKKRLVLFGAALTLSWVAAMLIASSPNFPSVWCFYAAVLSISLYLYFRYSARANSPKKGDRIY